MIAINDKSGVKCEWDQKHFQIIIIFLRCNASFSEFKEKKKKNNRTRIIPGNFKQLLLLFAFNFTTIQEIEKRGGGVKRWKERSRKFYPKVKQCSFGQTAKDTMSKLIWHSLRWEGTERSEILQWPS